MNPPAYVKENVVADQLPPAYRPHVPAYEDELPPPPSAAWSSYDVVVVPDGDRVCPFVGCTGKCSSPFECGLGRQFDDSLVVMYLKSTACSVSWRDLIECDGAMHGRIVSEAQQWERAAQDQAEKGVVIHHVSSTDTLQGIAIKYSVSAAVIKKFNRMSTTDIFAYRFIRVPTSASSRQLWSPSPGPRALSIIARLSIIRTLQKLIGVDVDEARVLLEIRNYDVDQAVKEHAAWGEAETSLRKGGAKTLQEFMYLQASK